MEIALAKRTTAPKIERLKLNSWINALRERVFADSREFGEEVARIVGNQLHKTPPLW